MIREDLQKYTVEGINAEFRKRIESMRMGVEYKFEAKIRDFSIFLRPLSCSEMINITDKVTAQVSSLPEHLRNIKKQSFILSKEILKLSSTSDVGKLDYKIDDSFLDRCTEQELSHIYENYIKTIDKCDPSLELMKEKDILEIVDNIKKNQNQVHLASTLIELSFAELVSLAAYLLTKKDLLEDK